MEANPYIDALGKAIGTELSLSASGSVGLSLGGRNLLIRWVEATRSFVLYAEVGALNGWRSGEVCRRLLIANFLLMETQGATLSYNDATGMVGLNYPVPVYGLEADAFVRAVDNIVTLSEEWKTRLDALNRKQEEAVERAQEAILHAEEAPAETDFTAQSMPFLRV